MPTSQPFEGPTTRSEQLGNTPGPSFQHARPHPAHAQTCTCFAAGTTDVFSSVALDIPPKCERVKSSVGDRSKEKSCTCKSAEALSDAACKKCFLPLDRWESRSPERRGPAPPLGSWHFLWSHFVTPLVEHSHICALPVTPCYHFAGNRNCSAEETLSHCDSVKEGLLFERLL